MTNNVTYTNWIDAVINSILIGITIYAGVSVIESWIKYGFSINHLIGIVIFSSLTFLLLQMILLSIVKMEIKDRSITFSRPFQHLTWKRKKPNYITLTDDSWNEMYFFLSKHSGRLFFRLDQNAVMFISLDGCTAYIRRIKKAFPDKKIQDRDPFDFPKKVYRQVKKEYPERVFR
jgi:hypothetical protein